jgi:hypothetical protein
LILSVVVVIMVMVVVVVVMVVVVVVMVVVVVVMVVMVVVVVDAHGLNRQMQRELSRMDLMPKESQLRQ